MADEPENVTETEEAVNTEAPQQENVTPPKNKIPPRVLLICIISVVVLILSVGGWFLYKHFTANPESGKQGSQTEEGKETTPEGNSFLQMPEIVANLRTDKAKGNVLRAAFLLQLYKKEDEVKIKEYLPIILDQVLSYLRDQTVKDLEGPGIERMRQALLIRINNILRPLKIYRVVIKDFIIQ